MKQIDETGIKLCSIQGNIFTQSVNLDCSSAIFIRRFMYSDFAKHLDEGNFFSESYNTTDICLKEINEEYKSKKYGKLKYGYEELYWIGYIYRYFCYTQEKTSKYVFKIIQSKEMKELYFPYHSLDPKRVVERILESKNIKNMDLISKGVEIYRNIKN